jgi:hypothetical protein
MPRTHTMRNRKQMTRFLKTLPGDVADAAVDELPRIAKDSADEARRLARSQGGVARMVAPTIRADGPTVKAGDSRPLPTSGSGWSRRRHGPENTTAALVMAAEWGSNDARFPGHGPRSAGYFLTPTMDPDEVAGRVADAMIDGVDDAAR